MLNIRLLIRNPFNHDDEFTDTICYKFGPVLRTENKFWEFQIYRTKEIFFKIGLDITNRGDHAGIMFELNLFGFDLNFHFYDQRHWDYENNRYYLYGEDDDETGDLEK